MPKYHIYNPDGKELCTAVSVTMTGKWMEDANVVADADSPFPLEFTCGCYIDFMGDRFVMYDEPGVEKTARRDTHGGAFHYRGLRFDNCSKLLKNIRMFDTVLDENNAAYNVNPSFSLFCDDISKFADLIRANIRRVYRLYNDTAEDWTENAGAWMVIVASGEYATNVSVEINNMSVFDALQLVATKFLSSYTIRCDSDGVNIVTIGSFIDRKELIGLAYGKDNGLVSIEKVLNTDTPLISCVRAYGSSVNMPDNFYKNSYRPDFQIPWWMTTKHFMHDGKTLQTTGLKRYPKDEYIALSESCDEYSSFALIVFYENVGSTDNASSFKNIVPSQVFMYIPVYQALMQGEDFEFHFRDHPDTVLTGNIYGKGGGPKYEGMDPSQNVGDSNLGIDKRPFSDFKYFRIIDKDGLIDYNCSSSQFWQSKYMCIRINRFRDGSFYTTAQLGALLAESPVVVTKGILKKYTYSHKQWWFSPYPLLPQALAVNNLMLPGFNWYIVRSDVSSDSFDIADVELDRRFLLANPFNTEKVYDANGKLLKMRFTDTYGNERQFYPCWFIPGSTTRAIAIPESGYEGRYGTTEKVLATARDVRVTRKTAVSDTMMTNTDIDRYGLRETVVFFDGSSEDFPEIKPTIQGMSAARARKAGYNLTVPDGDNGLLDEILYADQIADDGSDELVGSAMGTVYPSSFNIYIKDIGFDIKEYLSDANAEVVMESGSCGSRSFELVDSNLNPSKVTVYIRNSDGSGDSISVVDPESGNHITVVNRRDVSLTAKDGYVPHTAWKVQLMRRHDDTLKRWFPNSDYQVSGTLRDDIRREDVTAGIFHSDRFALVNIEMPYEYIDIASQRLYEAAMEYLLRYNHERYSYNIRISANFAARNPKVRTALREGQIAVIQDDDIGARIGISEGQERWYVDSVTVRDSTGARLPEWNVTLRQEKELSAIQKINSRIVYLQTMFTSSLSGSASPTGVSRVQAAAGGSSGGGSDANYEFTQQRLSSEWTIEHGLNKRPSVTVIDGNGNEVIADIRYNSPDSITINFAAPATGKAILN